MDDQGDVKMVTGGTKMGGPGFGFAFLHVSRLGIVSVKGNRIGVAMVAPKASAVAQRVLKITSTTLWT